MGRKIKRKKSDRTDKLKHVLVPNHTKLSEADKKKLFKKYNISLQELPKTLVDDPAIRHLNPKEGDVVKIDRDDPVLGKSTYYRGVINA